MAKIKSFGLIDVVVWWIVKCLPGRVSRVHVGREYPGAISMHSGFPQGPMIGPLLFLLFLNDLADVLEALTLLFADDAWDLPVNPTKCNNVIIGQELSMRFSFFPMGLAPPSLYPNKSRL